jgi:hypothetical protein
MGLPIPHSMKAKLIIGLMAVILLPTQSEAKLTKYWVLKMGDSGGNYRAFTSPEACDAALRKYMADTKKIQARFKDLKLNTSAKCLNHLPYGYEIMR